MTTQTEPIRSNRPAWTPLTTLMAMLAVAAVLSADCGLEARQIETCGPATRLDPTGPRLFGARLVRLARDLAAGQTMVAEHCAERFGSLLAIVSCPDFAEAAREGWPVSPDLRPEWLNLPPPVSG